MNLSIKMAATSVADFVHKHDHYIQAYATQNIGASEYRLTCLKSMVYSYILSFLAGSGISLRKANYDTAIQDTVYLSGLLLFTVVFTFGGRLICSTSKSILWKFAVEKSSHMHYHKANHNLRFALLERNLSTNLDFVCSESHFDVRPTMRSSRSPASAISYSSCNKSHCGRHTQSQQCNIHFSQPFAVFTWKKKYKLRNWK